MEPCEKPRNVLNFMGEVKKRGIYFHLATQDLSYLSVCLAEGLEQLGVPFYCNRDHYPRPYDNMGLLFKQSSKRPQESAICVFDVSFLSMGAEHEIPLKEINETLRGQEGGRSVFLSNSDSNRHLVLKSEVPLFVTHENRYEIIPGRRIPWAFGISREILVSTAQQRREYVRKRVLLRNFRPTNSQGLRLALDFALLPILEKHFEIDRNVDQRGRFEPSHFDKLNTYMGCLAYGGNFVEDLTRNTYFNDRPTSPGRLLKEPIIVRWDSWRFWESLACGCLTFHLDFEKYGFSLPEMPENWVHYIGLDLSNLPQGVERLLDEFDTLPAIAEAGKKWAVEHYSPKAVALRFIETLFRLEIS